VPTRVPRPEALLREIFPIYSYDKTMCLEYVGYELGRPRYTIDECRKLRMTFGYPFKVRLRLVKPEPVEEEVYLGEIPIMIGGGEFIINGSERVIVSQLHRSPGVDFSVDASTADKKLHSCWIIPERGSWIELNVTKKDVPHRPHRPVGQVLAITLLRALDPKFRRTGTPARVLPDQGRQEVEDADPEGAFAKKITDKIAVGDIVVLKTGECSSRPASRSPRRRRSRSPPRDLAEVEIIDAEPNDLDMLIINTLHEDRPRATRRRCSRSTAPASGQPAAAREGARALPREVLRRDQRYRLGRVGRFRLNRKFGTQDIPRTSRPAAAGHRQLDQVPARPARGEPGEVDDIDNLGNRRVRTIAELAGDEFRKGLLKLRRTAQERMNLENPRRSRRAT
jgi:DNA-directed RNA polymerase subunit beta